MTKTLLIDIGGTKTAIAIGDENNIDLDNIKVFATEKNPEHLIETILLESKKFGTYEKINLSLPGRWNKQGILEESHFLHEWLGYPFIKTLSDRAVIKDVAFETDVICGGLGEYYFGVGRNEFSSLLYINLGTGIGASLIQDGKPFKSFRKDNSSQVLTLRLQKLVFPFGDELYSGTDFISGGTLSKIGVCESVEALFSAYKAADPEAIDTISNSQMQLAGWLINLFYLFAPEVIVLNGGLTFDWEVIADAAIDIAKEELGNQVLILPSQLKQSAPLYGALKVRN